MKVNLTLLRRVAGSVTTSMLPNWLVNRHVTYILIVTLGALQVIACLIVGAGVRLQIEQGFDEALLGGSQAFLRLNQYSSNGLGSEFADEVIPTFNTESLTYQHYTLDMGETPKHRNSILNLSPGDTSPLSDELSYVHTLLLDGRAGPRIGFLMPAQMDEELLGTLAPQIAGIVLIADRERSNPMIASTQVTLVFVVLVIILMSALLTRMFTGVWSRSVANVRDQIATLDVVSLDTRLSSPSATEELDGLVDQCNALLDRIEAKFSREKRFSSDVAHELRAPLAELRNLAEVGGRWPGDRAMVQRFFRDVVASTLQMERIVADLLNMARQEKTALQSSSFDLVDLLETSWQPLQSDADSRDLKFKYRGPESIKVHSSRDHWALILRNLLNNAVTYSPSGNQVVCSIVKQEHFLMLTVTNRSEDLRREDLELMFDRFWRKDGSRQADHHTGLGLALVEAYATQLGLTKEAHLSQDRMFSLSLVGKIDLVKSINRNGDR